MMRTAFTAIKKEQEKLKLETMRSNLVDREQSLEWVRNLVAECRSALLNFPRRMAVHWHRSAMPARLNSCCARKSITS